MLAKWKIALIVIAATGVLAAIIAQALISKNRRSTAQRRIADACNGNTSTIFVGIVSRNAMVTGELIHQAFALAHCPLRVHFGVYEVMRGSGDDDTSCLTVYNAMVKGAGSEAPFVLSDNIKCVKVPGAEYRGELAAREQLERFLYNNQSYVMTLRGDVKLAEGWDKALVEALDKAEAGSSPNPDVILTVRPVYMPAANDSAPGSFTAVPRLTDSHPIQMPVRMKRRVPSAVPAVVFSSALSFARGARVSGVPFPFATGRVVDDPDALDFLMTCLLVERNWRVMHPPGLVCVTRITPPVGVTATVPPLPLPHSQREDLLALLPPNADILYNALTRDAHLRLGLSPEPSATELLAKVGGSEEYISLLSRMELAGV